MRDFIQNLIDKKKERYKKDYDEMLGDYNRENETVRGYNGRQILELLQNCDDEGASEVHISLDTNNETISISNNGTPFSEKGYRSLFISNLSSKRSKKLYIGSKGLGFRSIIKWSSAVEIQSNNLSVRFSEKGRVDGFNELFPPKLQNKIRAEEKLDPSVIPMPFLSMPEELRTIKQKDFVTTIIINYKEEYLAKIIDQVSNITPETILFLKSINTIRFHGFEYVEDIICEKINLKNANNVFSPSQKVVFKNNTWYIFETEDDLPFKSAQSGNNETEFYQIKIAVEKTFSKSSPYLYSFFPTNIQFKQPYILHATFDLDPTRNQINESDENRYILQKIVDFTIKVAKYYADKKVNYKPLEILNHVHIADTLSNLGYYELVSKAIESEEIFACIDNTYRRLKEVIYISDVFAEMLLKINAVDYLGMHLIPLEDRKLSNFNLENKIRKNLNVLSDVISVINNIAGLKLTSEERALFISQILKECAFIKNEYTNQCSFLTNDIDDIINGQEYIYTPITQTNPLQTPTFTRIQFINKDVFNHLIDYLKYDESGSDNKSRFIYEQLTKFCNIHSYEPATLAQKIISETNIKIKEDAKKAAVYIKEMNNCLFFNFKLLDDTTKQSPLKATIPTITVNDIIKSTADVVLSKHYHTGKKTELIFEGIYKEENYIASPINLGIGKEENINEIESYLKWINVNPFALYRKETTSNKIVDYFNFVDELKHLENTTAYEITYQYIVNLEFILNKISLPRLVLWIYFDDVLRKQMYDAVNDDIFKNYYYSYHIISNKPSYLKFVLQSKYHIILSGYLIDEKYSWVNEFNIDYRAKEFVDNGISKSTINEILVSLGAKEDIADLPIEKIAEIINKMSGQYPDGRKSQSFYKKALSHYRVHQEELTVPVRLYADNGTGLRLYDQNEIYFSEKIKLPKRLKKEFPIFNFPARAGGSDAIKFFKINDLKNINIKILSHPELKEITGEFKAFFTTLKPLLLTQRINVIDDSKQQKEQASICNKIEIILCSDVKFKVKGVDYDIAEYEFLHFKDYTYFIKIKAYDTLSRLRKNINFIETFADIISLSFDISGERNEFKYMFRSDYEDVLSNIRGEFGNDTLQEARELLGLADYKQAFWQAVFVSKGVPFKKQLDDLTLEACIMEKFMVDFDLSSIDYEKLNDGTELLKIRSLFELLNLELDEFAKSYPDKISMTDIHFLGLKKNKILSKKNLIKTAVWNHLKKFGIEEQAKFLNEINKFEDYDQFVSNKANESSLEFSIDADNMAEEYIHSIYGKIDLTEDVNLEEIKNQNEEKFDADQLYEISQSERFKSLLYFPESLQALLIELSNAPEPTVDLPISPSSTSEINIISSDNLIPSTPVSKNVGGRKKVFTPKDSVNKGKKQKGNAAEKIVYDYLINNNFSNVDRVSFDNEGLHYDIRYTDEYGVVKYVEAKTFDNGCFFLSRPEYDFGSSNKEVYEIWLVMDKQKIIPIKDFFSNPKYEAISNEYLVLLDLINN